MRAALSQLPPLARPGFVRACKSSPIASYGRVACLPLLTPSHPPPLAPRRPLPTPPTVQRHRRLPAAKLRASSCSGHGPRRTPSPVLPSRIPPTRSRPLLSPASPSLLLPSSPVPPACGVAVAITLVPLA